MKRSAVMVAFWGVLTSRQLLFLRTLRKRGWSLTVIVWDREVDGEPPELPDGLVDEVVTISVPAPTWSLRLLLRLPAYLMELLHEVRRRHDRDQLWVLTHYLLLPVAPFLPGAVLYDAAEMYAIDLGFYGGPARRALTAALSALELLMARSVDGITTVDSLDDWLAGRYTSDRHPVAVLWNVPSIDDDRNGACPPLVEELRGFPLVAFAGGLMKEKGVRVALEAAAIVRRDVPDVRFLFFGPIKDDELEVSRLVEEHRLEDAVRFLPTIPYGDLQVVLRHCQVGLALYQPVFHYPLVSAGNARKVFSYMQAGVPVVAPTFGEIGKAVADVGCGYLIDTEDPRAVAGAILEILTNEEEGLSMGARGRDAFKTRFNWEREEDKLVELVDEITAPTVRAS